MTRAEFVQKCALLGIGAPFASMLLESCGEEGFYPDFEVNFSGKVLIIGAGAAGLTAGYLLNKYNVNFEILEASADFGGRLKRAPTFADFPIDLGAEWIHEDPSVLSRLLSDSSQNDSIEVITYSPDTVYNWNNGVLAPHNWAANFYSEYKFKNSTWYGYFEKYFLPGIGSNIRYNSPVVDIDYAGSQIVVTDSGSNTYLADRVLVTVPLKILQNGTINFNPPLPARKLDAVNAVNMPDGIKVFIEFSERFYPDIILIGDLVSAFEASNYTFYNAAFRKDSSKNVLGLFAVGDAATPYTSLPTSQDIINKILGELDEMFDGRASENFVQFIVQNWSNEPYIQGSYVTDFGSDEEATQQALIDPIDNKVFFSGEAMSVDNSATVPGAAESSYTAIETILKG